MTLRSLATVVVFLLCAAPAAGGDEDGGPEPHPGDECFFTVVLDEEDRGYFEALPESEKPRWRRRYWTSLDPTPTTDENQREMEHQRRVVEAIRTFRNKNDRFVFDDRARALIRFGAPERRVTLPGEVVIHEGIRPPREFWLYGDMILWFEDERLNGEYREGLKSVTSLIGARDQFLREDTGWMYDEQLLFEEGFDRFLTVNDIEIDPVLAERYVDDGMHRWEEVPEINEYDYAGGEEFRFFFDVSYLAGVGGRTDILIGFLVPLDKVEVGVEMGVERVNLQRRAALFDENRELVARKVGNLSHDADPAVGLSRWIVTCDSFSVAPAPYQLALRVLDPRSNNHGILTTDLVVPDFRDIRIRVSDIVFASDIERSDSGEGAYLRNGYRIVPRPIRIYAPGEDVKIYFEIYHITTGEGGRGLYEVEYTLFGTKTERFVGFFGGTSEGKLEQGIGQTFRTVGRGPTANRHISIDTSSLPDDRYTLIVDVTDLADGTTDQAKAQFVVKK